MGQVQHHVDFFAHFRLRTAAQRATANGDIEQIVAATKLAFGPHRCSARYRHAKRSPPIPCRARALCLRISHDVETPPPVRLSHDSYPPRSVSLSVSPQNAVFAYATTSRSCCVGSESFRPAIWSALGHRARTRVCVTTWPRYARSNPRCERDLPENAHVRVRAVPAWGPQKPLRHRESRVPRGSCASAMGQS